MTWERLERFISNKRDVILAMTCIILFLYIMMRQPRVIVQPNSSGLSELQHYKDENGKLHSVIQQQQVDFNAEKKVYTDSLAKVLKVKPKQIKGVDNIVVETDTLFYPLATKPIIRYKDTAYMVVKEDPWIDIVAIAGKDTGSISFKSIDTITRIEIVKNPIIGRSTRIINLSNTNPYNKINQGSSFVVREKQVWLTIGPSVQYSPFSQRVSVGISAQVPIIKLKR